MRELFAFNSIRNSYDYFSTFHEPCDWTGDDKVVSPEICFVS